MDRSTVRPIAMIAALILIGVLLGAQIYTMKPPPPREIGAPDRLFSAERAKATLDDLLAEEAPHPAGTQANIQVRSRIAEKFESYGYEVEKQDAVYYAENRAAFYSLQNLMVKLPGREDGPAIAVVAHHDSVGAGPGASDDAANVAAILEIARMLKQGEPFRNPILFLITDGEEHWLLGAKAFMEEHPWAKEIGAVINLEARGTAGRSIMFETSEKNSWLINAYARSVQSPEAASISYEIYKRMPNDTDFTVFKDAGIPGMNFAFIQNKELYHTALDNRENLSLGSLQHQGENVLSVVRKLADMDLDFPSLENRVYLSLFGAWFVSWPESWNIWGLWIDFALLLFVLFVLLKYKYLDKRMLGWGVLAWVVVVVATVFVASSLMKGLSALSGVAAPWYAFPLASRIALAGSVLFLGWILGLYYAKKAGFWGLLMGNLFWWTIAAIALVYAAPLASYVVLGPLDAAAYLLFVICFTPLKKYFFFREFAALIPALITAYLWIGVAFGVDLAFGLAKSEWVAFPIALILTSLLPLCAVDKARRKSHKILLTLTLLVVIGSSAAALYFPPFSETAPQRMNLIYQEDGGRRTAQWIAQGQAPIPNALREAGSFSTDLQFDFPESGWTAEAPAIGLAASEITIDQRNQSANGCVYQFTIKKSDWADRMNLLFSETVMIEALSINDRDVKPILKQGYRSVSYYGVPEDGLQIRLEVLNQESISFLLFNEAYGLPSEGSSLLEARKPLATPFQWGDETRLIQRVYLEAAAPPKVEIPSEKPEAAEERVSPEAERMEEQAETEKTAAPAEKTIPPLETPEETPAVEKISAPTQEEAESAAKEIIEQATKALSEEASEAVEKATSVIEKADDVIQQASGAIQEITPPKL